MTKENRKQVLLLSVSNNYKTGMGVKQAVCRAWKGRPSQDVEYVLAIADSQVGGMFRILCWYRDKDEPKRWAFDAEEVPMDMRQKYDNKKFRMYGPMGYTDIIS